MIHIPVLQKEVLQYLDPKPNENFIDATIDGGGHTAAILGKIKPNGETLGIEIDPEIYQELKSKNLERLILVNDSYTNLKKIIEKYKFGLVSGIFARRITKRIIKERPVKTTLQLVEIIKRVVTGRTKINPATRTFQALRIAVNDELNNLRKVLPQTIEVLAPGGKIVIISFHSLEDRIVKKFFKGEFKKGSLEILTKKPVRPSKEEIKINSRSHSAKLRAAMKQ